VEAYIGVVVKLYEFETFYPIWRTMEPQEMERPTGRRRRKKGREKSITATYAISHESTFCVYCSNGSSTIVKDLKTLRIITMLFSIENGNDSKHHVIFN
jgi:hypothetical protein